MGKEEIDAAQTVEERKKIFRHLIKDLKAQDDVKPKKEGGKTTSTKTPAKKVSEEARPPIPTITYKVI